MTNILESSNITKTKKIVVDRRLNNFRYDINALRALAVTGVLLFHYKVENFNGGFSGVDIFFVISGYLMTSIIFNSISNNTFSYKHYFTKRLKRIVPALLFMISIITIIGFFSYFPEDYKLNEKNAAASVLFLSNIFYWRTANYFAPAAETNIFLHTWSLSVEWQFYIFYPVYLLLLNKIFIKRKQLKIFFIGLALIACIFSIVFTNIKSNTTFYLLPFRSWEMLVGGIAFFTESSIKSLKWKKIITVIGYIAALSCLTLLNENVTWPGILTLIPVIATFLIIIGNYNDLKLINNGIVQFLGKISYSLYLWHWPIYVISKYYGIEPNIKNVFVLTLLSVIAAYISYKYIETINFKRSKLIIASVIVLFGTTATLGWFNTNHFLYDKVTLAISNYNHQHKNDLIQQYKRGTCHVESLKTFKKESCLCIEKGKKNILLIGDSHMGQLSQSLTERGTERNIHFLQATASAQLPTINDIQQRDKEGRALIDYIFFDFIKNNTNSLDGVIITGSWAGQNKLTCPDSIILKAIKETVGFLTKLNIKTIVIGQSERYIIPYATIAARDYENNTITNYRYLDQHAYELDNYLSRNLGSNYVRIINSNTFPPLSPKNEPYMTDDHHLSKYGADLIVEKLFSNPNMINFLQ